MTVPLLTSPNLTARPRVVHGFTTRVGGVSQGPRQSLHLAFKAGDSESEIEENWRRALASLAADVGALALIHQVHGADVAHVHAPGGPLRPVATADAAVTTEPGIVLAVRTADCVPVLLAAPGGVAVAHAGWRGVVAGVVPAAVRALCEATGCAPYQVTAAIGPHAGVERYEVGPEVVQALVDAGLPREQVSRWGARAREHADLGAATRIQLQRSGVHDVSSLEACTLAESRFFSHRRDGAQTGRQAGMIVMGMPT